MSEGFYSCLCFLERNYYIGSLGLHLTFHNEEQFLQDCRQVLESKNCSDRDIKVILKELNEEKRRREGLEQQARLRQELISKNFLPLHPQVYNLQETYLAPEFLTLVSYCRTAGATTEGLVSRLSQKGDQIYQLPVFSNIFCKLFMEELCHFEQTDLPKGRPNTMNNYGILLNELGFDEGLMTPLREKYITPLTTLLFPDCGGSQLDSHKAFIVQYKTDQDRALDYHYDNAEVTLNVSLGKDFEEGSLYFGPMRTDAPPSGGSVQYVECTHRTSYGLMHRGQHLHGALPIAEGERFNLIVWLRSSVVRNRLCPMCDRVPELVPAAGFGDGFTHQTVQVCNLT